MNNPEVVLCLDVFDVNAAVAWWRALANFHPVHQHAIGQIGERVRLRSELVPSLELDLHTCRPRPVTGCTIGSIRSITIHLDDPEAAVAALGAALGAAAVIEVERGEGSITLRDSHGYLICVAAHRREGSACTASIPL